MNSVSIFKVENGLECILANMPDSHSCTISAMIRTGSVYEKENIRGGAHLLEHLLFKGNELYPDQFRLTQKLDSMGARFNAYTDSGMVSFHIKISKKYVSEAISILGYMIVTSLLGKKELEEEKMVVIQELEKDYDEPASYVGELLMKKVYKGCNYEYPVGGTKDSVANMSRRSLYKFWKENYTSNNIVLSLAGNLDISVVKEAINASPFVTNLTTGKKNNYLGKPKIQSNPRCSFEIRKKMSQIQLSIAFPTFSNSNREKYALDLIKIVLAGPMSSRLFQILRTKYGLAYYVGSNISLNNSCGDFSIHSGVDGSEIFTKKIRSLEKGKSDPLTIILTEIFRLTKEKITSEELSTAKEYLKGSVILDSEDTETISQYYGRQKIQELEIITISHFLDIIDNITRNEIIEVAKKIFQVSKVNIAIVGEIDPDKLKKYTNDIPNFFG